MTGKYSESQFEIIYVRAKSVYQGDLKISDAVTDLEINFDVNESSAKYFLAAVVNSLSDGRKSFYRTSTSIEFTRYFLSRIQTEFPSEKFQLAIDCVYRHVDYWTRANRNQNIEMVSFLDMLEEFRPKLSLSIGDNKHFEIDSSDARALKLKFEIEFEQIEKLSRESRKRESKRFPTKPRRILTTTWGFVRNPVVVLEVLERANGLCEKCGIDGPFVKKSDDRLYLEVHHKIPLAEYGDDTIENAIALANC